MLENRKEIRYREGECTEPHSSFSYDKPWPIFAVHSMTGLRVSTNQVSFQISLSIDTHRYLHHGKGFL